MIDMDSCTTFADLWEARVSNSPERLFLIFEEENGDVTTFSYEDFDERVWAACEYFESRCVKKGDRVIVAARNCPEVVAARIALGKMGAVLVPINPCSTVDDILRYVQLCEPKLLMMLVASSEEKQKALHAGTGNVDLVFHTEVGTLFNERKNKKIKIANSALVDPEDILEIVFTSGSTSVPKGVEITHSNAIHASRINAIAFSLRQDDRFMIAVPQFHVDAPYGAIAPSILVGSTVVMMEKYSASKYISQCAKHEATLSHCVAMMIKTMLMQNSGPNDKNHRLRHISFFMSITDEERREFVERFGVRLINSYGLSESVTSVTMDKLTGGINFDSIGTPLYPFQIRIVNNCGFDRRLREVGEIWIRGVPGQTIMKGYFRDEEATTKTIVDGEWLKTGDLGYMDEYGSIHFVDRIKNIIKCKGENVSAAEVEDCLEALHGVYEAVVLGVRDDVCGESVMAAIVPCSSESLSEDVLRAHCAKRLATYKVPTAFVFVDDFPRTATGKVDKATLKKSLFFENNK